MIPIIFFMCSIVNGQSFYINGKVPPKQQDSVEICVYPYFSFYWQNANAVKHEAALINNTFSFRTDLQCSHSYISVYLKNNENYTPLIILYLITPGDSIHLEVTNDSILFSGKGAAKFICQYKAQKVPEISFSRQEFLSFNNNTKSLAFNMYRKRKMDSLSNLKLAILGEYKSYLPINVYRQLRVNYVTENLFKQYNSLQFRYDSSEDATVRNDKILFFRELEKYGLAENTDGTLLAESSSASDYLLCKAVKKLQFQNYLEEKPFQEKYSPLKIAALACQTFEGIIKERLLAVSFDLFYRPQNEEEVNELGIALKETTSRYFHTYLSALKTAMNPGLEAYNFSLRNTTGKLVSLTDFKGKVVVLDFWFTGCGYCVILESRMKNMRKVFKNDTSIVFIGVCLDNDKKQFIKSVASGKYTGQNEINLYTGGAAFDHPLLKHYNITGCPELVIIGKNQKTFISKPARPVDEATDNDFINLLLKAEEPEN